MLEPPEGSHLVSQFIPIGKKFRSHGFANTAEIAGRNIKPNPKLAKDSQSKSPHISTQSPDAPS